MTNQYTDDTARVDLRVAETASAAAAAAAYLRAARAGDRELRVAALAGACRVLDASPRLETGIRAVALFGLIISLVAGVWFWSVVGGPWGISYLLALSAQGVIWYVLCSGLARALEYLTRIDAYLRRVTEHLNAP